MTITVVSLLYAFVVGIIFYIIPVNARKYLLALASLTYVFGLDKYAGAIVTVTSLFTWLFSMMIGSFVEKGEQKKAKLCTFAAVCLYALALCMFKFLPARGGLFGKLFLPIGFSFYVFQAISYVVDVKRGTTKAEKDPINVVLYLSFFPKFVSGPIERFEGFNKQIYALKYVKFKDRERFKLALYYVLFGMFMKLVIADRLGIYVDKLFEDRGNYGTLILIAGVIAYTFQIYCDFAGYTFVAIGVSKIYGIDILQNFNVPYMAENITEFWRRWHMSLSSWLKDYVYIPLGGNRKGPVRKIINTMIIFAICGVWHGVGFSFLAWGLMHGLFSGVDAILKSKGIELVRKGAIGRIIMFLEVAFAWIFFRASSFTAAVSYISFTVKNLVMGETLWAQLHSLGINQVELILILVLVTLQIFFDYIAYKKNKDIPSMIASNSDSVRYAVFYVLVVTIFIFGIYGPDMATKPIYMQF